MYRESTIAIHMEVTMTDDRFMSTTEVCELLNLRPQTLRKWRFMEFGPLFTKIGNSGRVLYYRDSVMAFIADSDKQHHRYIEKWVKKRSGRLMNQKSRRSDYVLRKSQMGTKFEYDIGFSRYHHEHDDYDERARIYNDIAQNF